MRAVLCSLLDASWPRMQLRGRIFTNIDGRFVVLSDTSTVSPYIVGINQDRLEVLICRKLPFQQKSKCPLRLAR